MFCKMNVGATILVALSIWSSGAAAETKYSCWFPALCIAPDGKCRQSSLKVEFSLSDVVIDKRVGGRSMFGFPDFSIIYVQEDSEPNQECSPDACLQSQYVKFYDEAYQTDENATNSAKIPRGNIETGYGVCQIHVEQKQDTL